MELYIDSANLSEIKKAFSWGIIDGVTTNPSLIKKAVDQLKSQGEHINMQQYISALLQVAGAEHPVSLEVVATDAQGMFDQGKKLYQLFNGVAGNVVVKIPVNSDMGSGNSFDALKVIKALSDAEIPVNATLIFTPEQALLAAKAGATYVSPFAGRVDDFLRDSVQMEYEKSDYFPAEGEDTAEDEEDMQDNGVVSGVDLVTQIVELFEKHEIDCNVLAASLRNPRQVRECALAGADCATVPYSILKQLTSHIKTMEGMKKFTEDVVPEYAALFGGTAPTSSPIHHPDRPKDMPVQQSPPQQANFQSPPVQRTPQTPPATPSAHEMVL